MEENEFIAHIRKTDGEKQTVKKHLEQTAILAKGNADKIGLPLMGELCGLLHDLGKYSDEFQTYIKSANGLIQPDDERYVDPLTKKGRIDHATAGAQLVWKTCSQENHSEILLKQMLALCIASHHNRPGLMDCIAPDGSTPFLERMNKADIQTHLSEVEETVEPRVFRQIESLLHSPELLDEIEELLRRILNHTKSIEGILDFRLGMTARFLFSCLIDADWIHTGNFRIPGLATKRLQGEYVSWEKLIDVLETHLATFNMKTDVDPLRTDISKNCLDFAQRERGLFSLTVPTGGGKTLASLRFALHHAHKNTMTRIIYVVPYTSIIDQNADDVRQIFSTLSKQEQKEIVLEHHSNLAPEKETTQGKIIAENWDAQIIFTTAVQFLESLFGRGRRVVRRLHQLANAVIIFDEVQTLPIRTVHLFNNAVNFLIDICGSTVVFCTATQPCLEKVDPVKGAVTFESGHEMIPDVKALFRKLQRVQVHDKTKAGGWSEKEITELAKKCLKDTGSVLIVMNTKKAAKRVYQHCKKLTKEVYHLSTRMCPAHRLHVLKKVKDCLNPNHSQPVICISTQLVEAGVNLDAGSVIRCLAGLDSIAQAAGRCNRNGWRDSGHLYIANLRDECPDDRLEEICIGQKITKTMLREFKENPERFDHDIIGYEALKRYYHLYFLECAKAMDYQSKELDTTLLSLLSSNTQYVKRWKKPQDVHVMLKQSFQTAATEFEVISSSTQGVFVPYGKEGKHIINTLCTTFEPGKQFDLIKKAQRYSVNLFPYEIKKLWEDNSILEVQKSSGIFYLLKQHYSKDFGLAHEVVNEMEFLHVGNGEEEFDEESD